MGNYYGRYDRTLDDRGRLQLPAKLFSANVPDTFFALRGFEGCLAVYEVSAFKALQEKLSTISYLDPESRAFIRLALASVRELEVDNHGRITISKELSQRYKLGTEVVVLGIEDHFEIWDRQTFDAYEETEAASYEKLAAALGEKTHE